jgi:hypothetical protein
MTARSTTTATNELSRLDRAPFFGLSPTAFHTYCATGVVPTGSGCRDPRPGGGGQGWPSVIDFLVQSNLFDGGYPGTVASRLFAEPRRLGDQTRAALPGEIAPHPLPLDAKPVLQLGQKE